MDWFSRLFGQSHDWEYRNPGDRTCRCCGLQQNKFDNKFSFDFTSGWWEDMNVGFHAPCNHKVKARKIVGVACWYQNKMYQLAAPNRHHHLKAKFDGQMGGGADQGFVDEDGHFLTRRQAMFVAKNNGQLKRRPGGYDGPDLFSEDLW